MFEDMLEKRAQAHAQRKYREKEKTEAELKVIP